MRLKGHLCLIQTEQTITLNFPWISRTVYNSRGVYKQTKFSYRPSDLSTSLPTYCKNNRLDRIKKKGCCVWKRYTIIIGIWRGLGTLIPEQYSVVRSDKGFYGPILYILTMIPNPLKICWIHYIVQEDSEEK